MIPVIRTVHWSFAPFGQSPSSMFGLIWKNFLPRQCEDQGSWTTCLAPIATFAGDTCHSLGSSACCCRYFLRGRTAVGYTNPFHREGNADGFTVLLEVIWINSNYPWVVHALDLSQRMKRLCLNLVRGWIIITLFQPATAEPWILHVGCFK